LTIKCAISFAIEENHNISNCTSREPFSGKLFGVPVYALSEQACAPSETHAISVVLACR